MTYRIYKATVVESGDYADPTGHTVYLKFEGRRFEGQCEDDQRRYQVVVVMHKDAIVGLKEALPDICPRCGCLLPHPRYQEKAASPEGKWDPDDFSRYRPH